MCVLTGSTGLHLSVLDGNKISAISTSLWSSTHWQVLTQFLHIHIRISGPYTYKLLKVHVVLTMQY